MIDEDEIVARTPTKKSILKNSGGEDKDGKEKDGGNKKTVTPGPRATKHVSMPGEKLPTPPEKSTKKAGEGDTEKLKNKEKVCIMEWSMQRCSIAELTRVAKAHDADIVIASETGIGNSQTIENTLNEEATVEVLTTDTDIASIFFIILGALSFCCFCSYGLLKAH